MGTKTVSRTAAQIAASRKNAKLSTGPVTEAGKEIASCNSFKHGYTCVSMATLSVRNVEIVSEIQNGFFKDLRPVGIVEADLVRRIADESFRIRYIDLGIESLKLEGMEAARQFEPPEGSTGSRECAFVAATESTAFQQRLSLFLRYKAAAERAYFRALAALRQLQKDRRDEACRALQPARKQHVRDNPGFVSPNPDSIALPNLPITSIPPLNSLK
jgi:hypothetical protein